jgi:hypothetical protein
VGSRACLDVLEQRKIPCPYVDSNPRLSSPFLSYYTDCITVAYTGKKWTQEVWWEIKITKLKLHVSINIFVSLDLNVALSWTQYCLRHAEAPNAELVITLHLNVTLSWTQYCLRHAKAPNAELVITLHLSCCVWKGQQSCCTFPTASTSGECRKSATTLSLYSKSSTWQGWWHSRLPFLCQLWYSPPAPTCMSTSPKCLSLVRVFTLLSLQAFVTKMARWLEGNTGQYTEVHFKIQRLKLTF